MSRIDELVMVRVANKGDLYVHQGERSEREPLVIRAESASDRTTAPAA